MEMNIGKLTANVRVKSGKGNNRKMRATGQIPAVLYGGKGDNEMLSLDPMMLERCMDPVKKRNTLIELTVEGPAGQKVETVMVKDFQRDAISQDLLHIDLIRIGADEKLTLDIPLRLTGRPIGVQLGGRLNQVYRTVPVECLAAAIPSEILAEVEHLQVGEHISVSDLDLSEGVQILLEDTQTIAVVFQPKGVAEDEEETTDEEGEGEEGAAEATAEGGDKPAE